MSDKGSEQSYGEEADGDYDDMDELNDEDNVEIREDEDGDIDHEPRKGKRSYIKNTERITSCFLTKYERARILGTRALQLSKNAPPMIVP